MARNGGESSPRRANCDSSAKSLGSQSSTVVAASPVGTLVSQQPARIGQSANPLWLQAQQAEQNRDYAKAEACTDN